MSISSTQLGSGAATVSMALAPFRLPYCPGQLWDDPVPEPAAVPAGADRVLVNILAARGVGVDARCVAALPEPELVRLARLVLEDRFALAHHVGQLFGAVGCPDGIPEPWSLRGKCAARKGRIAHLALALRAAGLAEVGFDDERIDVEVDGATERYERFFGTGAWLEYAACDLVAEAAALLGETAVVWRSVLLDVPGRGRREIDVVALVGRSLVVVEVKSGNPRNVSLRRFAETAGALGLRSDVAIALVLDADPAAIRGLGLVEHVAVCSSRDFVAHLVSSIAPGAL